MFVLGFSKSSMIWCGCEDELARFLSIFGAQCQTDGSVYMFDSWSARRECLAQKLKLRHVHLASSALLDEFPSRGRRMATLLDACNPCSRAHGEGYEAMWEKRPNWERHMAFFCDWEQHPEKGKVRPASHVPCMLTHGNMVEHTSGRCLTNRELFAVHGWGTGPCEARFSSDVLNVIAASSAKKKDPAKLFLGNSMHIPTVLAVYLYAFTHAFRKDDADERAWFVARRSATWSQEVCANTAEEDVPPASSSAKGQKKGRGRGLKRPAAALAAHDSEDEEGAAGFRRATSSIFD